MTEVLDDHQQGCATKQPCLWSFYACVSGSSPCAYNDTLPAGSAALGLLTAVEPAHPAAAVSSVPGVGNYALQHLDVHPNQALLASMTDLLWQMVWHHALLV